MYDQKSLEHILTVGRPMRYTLPDPKGKHAGHVYRLYQGYVYQWLPDGTYNGYVCAGYLAERFGFVEDV